MLYTIQGKITPKQRPRFGSGNAYLPSKYRDWKQDAIAQLISQSIPSTPITRAEISIDLLGSHRGDIDNIAGSILDALVQSGILLDDRLSVVSKLSIDHRAAKSPSCSIDIKNL